MAQTGYTPIIHYHSTTAAAAPSAGNLNTGELGINVTDKKVFTKDGGGNVVQVGSGPSATDTLTNKTISLTNNTVSGTGAEFDTACTDQNFVFESDIGVTVQAYDADTAKTDTAQNWTGTPRATPLTDNDGSFDMNARLDFNCTPTGGITLTFTNIAQGQRGCIYLVNGSNYAIAAAATTKVTSSLLATISATGEYWLSYWSPDGTNVLVTAAGDFA